MERELSSTLRDRRRGDYHILWLEIIIDFDLEIWAQMYFLQLLHKADSRISRIMTSKSLEKKKQLRKVMQQDVGL